MANCSYNLGDFPKGRRLVSLPWRQAGERKGTGFCKWNLCFRVWILFCSLCGDCSKKVYGDFLFWGSGYRGKYLGIQVTALAFYLPTLACLRWFCILGSQEKTYEKTHSELSCAACRGPGTIALG